VETAAQEGWTLNLAVPVGPQLRRVLRERIIRSDLAPGAPLSESEIARIYAVSRQPVREAFIKLAEDGLVEVRPQRGTFVRKISRTAVMDARFVREAVEADIVRLLAGSLPAGALATLRRLLAAQREAAAAVDRKGFMELDDRFHHTLADLAGRGGAWKVIEESKSQMDRVRFLSFMQFPMEKLILQHEAVVDALAEGRAAEAEAAMRGHLREILVDLPRIADTVPGYFEAE